MHLYSGKLMRLCEDCRHSWVSSKCLFSSLSHFVDDNLPLSLSLFYSLINDSWFDWIQFECKKYRLCQSKGMQFAWIYNWYEKRLVFPVKYSFFFCQNHLQRSTQGIHIRPLIVIQFVKPTNAPTALWPYKPKRKRKRKRDEAF